jgi:hypothetical protein
MLAAGARDHWLSGAMSSSSRFCQVRVAGSHWNMRAVVDIVGS